MFHNIIPLTLLQKCRVAVSVNRSINEDNGGFSAPIASQAECVMCRIGIYLRERTGFIVANALSVGRLSLFSSDMDSLGVGEHGKKYPVEKFLT